MALEANSRAKNQKRDSNDLAQAVKVGERWLIGINGSLLLINLLIAFIYYQQLSQMRIATEATRKSVDLASDSLEISSGQFDRNMRQIVDQTITQYEAEKASTVAAKAAKSAADTAKNALHISTRAYLQVQPGRLDIPGKRILLQLANVGHIPTGETTIVVHEETLDLRNLDTSGRTRPIEVHWTEDKFPTLPQGIDREINVGIPRLDETKISAGEQQIVVVGSVTYNDGFPRTPEAIWSFCVGSGLRPNIKDVVLFPCDATTQLRESIRVDEYPSEKYHRNQ
jgi:hypothetical protein